MELNDAVLSQELSGCLEVAIEMRNSLFWNVIYFS